MYMKVTTKEINCLGHNGCRNSLLSIHLPINFRRRHGGSIGTWRGKKHMYLGAFMVSNEIPK
jgi:hypothetical protein